jgi:hypothetical protein
MGCEGASNSFTQDSPIVGKRVRRFLRVYQGPRPPAGLRGITIPTRLAVISAISGRSYEGLHNLMDCWVLLSFLLARRTVSKEAKATVIIITYTTGLISRMLKPLRYFLFSLVVHVPKQRIESDKRQHCGNTV